MSNHCSRSRRGPVIAIIGGGASGTLAAVHLLREATARRSPVSLVLVDRHGRHGLGQAYATTHPAHLLNTPAGQMSALAGEPDDLTRRAGVEPGSFLTRHAYGRYLSQTLSRAEELGRPASRLTRLTATVTAVRRNERGPALTLSMAGASLDADAAVLAIGGVPPELPFPVPDSPRIIVDPWAPGALEKAADGSPVLVAGTGLTMADVAIAVTSVNPRSTVRALSRHGLLPRVHRGLPGPQVRPWLPVACDETGTVRLGELLWQVRSAMAARGANWQDVVDALRPLVPSLWQRMPEADQRMFLRHVARYWEVHRHLLPPATAARVTELRCTGQLTVLKGEVNTVAADGDQLHVTVREGRKAAELTAGWLINATGQGANITHTRDPLLLQLLASGLARADPLRLGIDATADGAVLDDSGRRSNVLFALGPLLRGVLYETTSIPEIRGQAAAIACLLTSGRGDPQAAFGPGTAA